MNVSDKKLEELTIEEWGDLFPIKMMPPQADWALIFQKEKSLIKATLPKKAPLDIQHIGSTAIPGITSKGSIDMLIDIPEELLFDKEIILRMEHIGYEFCIQGGYGPAYMIFAKGFNRKGKKEQKYFVHMTPKNHSEMWDRIHFRDYLIKHIEVAKEYENLKLELSSKFSKDKRSFTKGKTEFVTRFTELAKKRNKKLN